MSPELRKKLAYLAQLSCDVDFQNYVLQELQSKKERLDKALRVVVEPIEIYRAQGKLEGLLEVERVFSDAREKLSKEKTRGK